jgi:hypothetical protein
MARWSKKSMHVPLKRPTQLNKIGPAPLSSSVAMLSITFVMSCCSEPCALFAVALLCSASQRADRDCESSPCSYPCIYCGPPSKYDFTLEEPDDELDAYSILDNFKAAMANKCAPKAASYHCSVSLCGARDLTSPAEMASGLYRRHIQTALLTMRTLPRRQRRCCPL